uniref:Calcium release activated channel regulator 2Ab n=1 Tax=Scophthalmus maximus TaxID=52904 RepID=A0A8D3C8B4_SCOMX
SVLFLCLTGYIRHQGSHHPKGSDWGRIALLDKTKEFFQTCDVEGKGFITRTDMRRLHRELPLSAAELEDVFDSLDTEHTGYLTLEVFSSGFSRFSCRPEVSSLPYSREALYQSQWEARLSGGEDGEEERHFCMLLESLGASNVFEDPGEVRSLWAELRRDEPHLLSNFEEFLARVTHQIKEAHQERKEMESALQRKAATHDSEIRHLYEEMEAQIKNEKDRLVLKDSERLQLRSQDLEHQLFSKEKELEQLFQKQKGLELQCRELNSEKQESRVENVKLKMTNDELSRALDSTSQDLSLAQEQLAMLQEQAARLHREKEMEMYRVTEGLQREKQSLMKQLDLLSAPACQQRPAAKKTSGFANGYANSAPPKVHDVKTRAKRAPSKTAAARRVPRKDRERGKKVETGTKSEVEEEVLDAPPDGWPLRRVISIEEDHLAHLLLGGPQPLLHQLSEEEDEDEDEDAAAEDAAQSDTESGHVPLATDASPAGRSRLGQAKKTPTSARGQPVGKETQQTREAALFVPDRLFKVVLVGNSSVGKTSLLRSFCEGRFHAATTATVGVDYSVKTLTLDNMQIAMQLWDTAGQERYRSITKQFFRKADGVVVMYDVTVEESFKAVQPWLVNVQEAAGEGIPVLLLGNKMDMDGEREVSFKDAEQLAHVSLIEMSRMFDRHVLSSCRPVSSLRVLMEQEDRVRDKTIILTAQPIKKKACCK